MEKIMHEKIARAELLANVLVLAIRGFSVDYSDTDINVLEGHTIELASVLAEVARATAPDPVEFVTVELTAIGPNKIEVIKVVRAFIGLSLKGAKDLVELAPIPLKELVAMSDATEIKRALEDVGATVRCLEPDNERPAAGPEGGGRMAL